MGNSFQCSTCSAFRSHTTEPTLGTLEAPSITSNSAIASGHVRFNALILRNAFMYGATLTFALANTLTVSAQDTPRRPRDPGVPSAPYERMTFFEGTWSSDGNPDAANGSPAPYAFEETCAWLTGGRRHMVCRSWRQTAQDSPRRESIYILSYREADSTYIAHFAFPGGATLVYHGRPEGTRWVMNLQPTPFWPANNRLRTIITAIPEGLRFVEESSVDGGPWKITEDYRHRRVK